MRKLNKTNQEQLIAEKNKAISITIQASNNKVKDKMKMAVPKDKKTGPIKDRLKVIQHANCGKQRKKDVIEAKRKTVIKEASKRKTKEVPRKEIKKKKGEVRKKDEEEEEEETAYEVNKLLNDRKCK